MARIQINRIYFFALSLYLLAKYTEISTIYYVVPAIPILMRVVRFAAYFLVLGVVLFNISHEKTIFLRYLFFIAILIVVSVISKSVTVLFNFIFVFEAKNIENKKLLSFVCTLQAITVGLIVAGCMAGIVPNWTYNIGGRFRESLGFFYPNRIASLYFFIVLAFCCYLAEKLNILHVIVLELLNIIIFHHTNTRMAFAMTTVSIPVFYCVRFRKEGLRNTRLSRVLYLHSLYIIPLSAIAICLIYSPSNSFLYMMNGFVNNRLMLGHNALYKYPITLFGQNIEWVGFGGLGYLYTQLPGEYNAVDCAYINILLDKGLLVFLMSVTGYMMSSYSELKRGNRRFCIAIVLMSIYCLVEPPYIETGFNPFVWTLSVLLTKKFIIRNRRECLFLDLKDVKSQQLKLVK